MADDAFDDFDDEDELDHFTDAQDTVWDSVLADLRTGQSQTDWCWFVFPVLTGIDDAPMAMFYSLRDCAEARDYVTHHILGDRLDTCFRLVMDHDQDAATLLGDTCAYKIRASATLFEAAVPHQPLFAKVLDQVFAGQRCTKTQRLLQQPPPDPF
ncbi:DUF1810 family protein [Loktanella sp. SALINAS62]|uniref:DUF1810 family protein n=1 Tax=Loktanella sp. SALINAS62 TaxID=2706124 RepID=UPI001B8D509A|nr:DUF1810 family protein [Loktanella sp. SALINAS62]MBS1301844.1 DUF1810 domain-containing protein [Loktanella sp. SALINAS62]